MAKQWYVLRVASNKEQQVCEALSRKVNIEGLTDLFGRILVPTERVTRIRGKQKRQVARKLYPGYVFVEMELGSDGRIPDNAWFLIKETTGVGDFIGAEGKPTPMQPHEVDKMLAVVDRPEEEATVDVKFKKGDRVKIREGPFENFEGDVEEVLADKGTVKVIVEVFQRPTPLELEYWQIEQV